MNELDLVREISKGYNRLNISYFIPILSDNVVYESQSVLSSITGKKDVVDFLDAKFRTVKDSGDVVFAEIAYWGKKKNEFGENIGRPCILMSQGSKENIGAVIVLEIISEKVNRIDICTVAPRWQMMMRTNEYP
jgi:hypothetical protein